jgi:hypothetical protein
VRAHPDAGGFGAEDHLMNFDNDFPLPLGEISTGSTCGSMFAR